nr:hypothetical protein [uncultured Aminipila sp.]
MKTHKIKDIKNIASSTQINENAELTMEDILEIVSISDGRIDEINNGFILGYLRGASLHENKNGSYCKAIK